MERCKYCFHDKFIKNGFVRGKQRYRCRHCGKNQIAGDRREKHKNSLRREALAMLHERKSLRHTARTLKVPHQLVAGWAESADKIIAREIENLYVNPRTISLLKKNDLPGYLKKKSAKYSYAWLWVGPEIRLLRLVA